MKSKLIRARYSCTTFVGAKLPKYATNLRYQAVMGNIGESSYCHRRRGATEYAHRRRFSALDATPPSDSGSSMTDLHSKHGVPHRVSTDVSNHGVSISQREQPDHLPMRAVDPARPMQDSCIVSAALQARNAYTHPDAPNVLQPLSSVHHERHGGRMINLGHAMYQCKMSRTSCFTLVRTLPRHTLRNHAFCGPVSVLSEYGDDLGGSFPLVR